MKTCSDCGESKPVEGFYKNSNGVDGRFKECKPCVLSNRRQRYERDGDVLRARVTKYQSAHRDEISERQRLKRAGNPVASQMETRRAYLKRYGLTPETWKALFISQGCLCAICSSAEPGRYWTVDHDHVSGNTRGILCWHCNVALGHFRDDPVSLLAAIDYLTQ